MLTSCMLMREELASWKKAITVYLHCSKAEGQCEQGRITFQMVLSVSDI